jgi:ElaA protein
MLEIKIKAFSELSTIELYEILQLRSKVFVVEQDCVYQDIDDHDQKAFHIMGLKAGKLVAYARIFKAGDHLDLASIGRVIIVKNERQFGYGRIIMKNAISAIEYQFGERSIKVSAQAYLKKFYESLGFKSEGKEYLEDGIPHIAMIRTC